MNKKKYTLGLDLGITSVGFALVNTDEKKIVKAGVHLFESAENPKTGASLAAPRRDARSQRRRNARRRMRLNAVMNSLKKHGFQDVDRITETPSTQRFNYNPWALRSEGLDRKLTDFEFGISIYHIAKHRGFRSSRVDNSHAKDKNIVGQMKSEIQSLKEEFESSTSETIGHFLYEKLQTLGHARNKSGNYSFTPLRELMQSELKRLCERQIELGHPKVTPELHATLDEIIFFQRPLKSIAAKIGKCSIFIEEYRAVRHAVSSELFVFWNKANNLRIGSSQEARALTAYERDILLKKLLEVEKLTFKQLRTLLKVDTQVAINLQRPEDKDSKTLFEFKGYHSLRKAIEAFDKNLWQTFKDNRELLDYIATVLSIHFDEHKIESELGKHPALATADPALITKLCEIISFKGTLNLSLKAINTLMPYLTEGKKYTDALNAAKLDGKIIVNKSNKESLLPPVEKTNNPVVDRALSQARKVTNAIIREYGLPREIKIELARDVGKSLNERKAIAKENKKNEERNTKAKEALESIGFESPTKDLVEKYKLWDEQNKTCPYSGQNISIADFKSERVQIDHIIPYSRSFDDSFQNKVLVFSSQNQNKQDRTPQEWFSPEEWQQFEGRVRDIYSTNKKKLKNLLIQEFDENALIERNLNDTRWISVRLKDHIKKKLAGVLNVDCTKGGITYTLRRQWLPGQPKDRTHHSHHAEDAILIALSSASLIQKVTKDIQRKAYQGSDHSPLTLPHPWETFSEDVKQAISEIQISRMPNRKYSGASNKGTIMSYRGAPYAAHSKRIFNDVTVDKHGQRISKVVKRIELADVTLTNLESMVDLNRNQALYKLLKQRLEDNKEDKKKAFAEPIYMPRKDGAQESQVKGIRIYDDSKALVPIQKGVANNGDMVRIDIFKSPKGFVVSPLYVMDFLNKQLPTFYVEKSIELPLDPEWAFQCTLQKNDYVELTSSNKKSKEKIIIRGFYVNFDRSGGTIKLQDVSEETHNLNTGEVNIAYFKKKRPGIKTLDDIQKYNITLLGEKHLVKQKKRQPLHTRSQKGI